MKYIVTFLSVFLLVLSVTVFAQTEDMSQQDLIQNPEQLLSEEIVSKNPLDLLTEEQRSKISFCNIDSNFGTVQIDLDSEISELVSGTTLTLNGQISNLSNNPISNGTLYARVLRSDGEEYAANIIDQFVVQENITISKNSAIPVSLEWNIPSIIETGDYKLVTYFYVNDKTDISGIVNSLELSGHSFDFSVSNEDSATPVRFEPAALGVNLEVYVFGSNPINVPNSGDVLITIPAYNISTEDRNVTVEWKVYKDNKKNKDNLIKTVYSDATIFADSSYEFALELKETEAATYHVVGELRDKDSKSFIEVLYVREGVSAAQVHSSEVRSYPLLKGESNTFSACVYSTGIDPVIQNGKVLLELKNSRGRVIEKYVYEGPITSQIMSVSKEFVSSKDLNSFSVHTSIWDNDTLLTSSVNNYDCKVLDPDNCKNDYVNQIFYIIGGLLLIILITIFGKKINKNKNIILPLFIFLSFTMIPFIGEAKSVNVYSPTISSMSTGGWPSYTMGSVRLGASYSAEVRNADTNAVIADNASVPEGTRLKFIFSNNQGISWSASSPKYLWGGGEWTSGQPSSACSGNYTDRSDLGGLTSNAYGIMVNTSTVIYTYLNATVSPVSKTITRTGNLNCAGMSGNSMICTVTGGGPISVTFNFSGTSARMYRSTSNVFTQSGYYVGGTQQTTTCNGPYQMNPTMSLPSATIQYQFQGAAAQPVNSAPNPPTITGPKIGNPSVDYTFGFRGTDPDSGDTVRYGIDWNNDNTVDEWTPGTGYVASGTLKNGIKSWGAIGTKTFKALTQDRAGLNSGWTTYSTTLSVSPTNGSCGTTNNSCIAGTSADSADSATNYLWNCNGANGGTNDSCSLTKPPVITNGLCGVSNNICTIGTLFDIADTSTDYLWRCRGENGGTVDSCSLTKPLARVNGLCGASNNICTTGTLSNITDSATNYLWNCNGANGGTNDSCSLPITGSNPNPFSVSCAAPSVLPGAQATFTATPLYNTGAVSYQWKEQDGTNIGGANSQTFRRTYSTIGSYRVDIAATSTGSGATNFCRVTVGCSDTHYEGKDATTCANSTKDVYTCTSSGWTTTPRPCVSDDEPTATFNFNPGIVSSVSGRCSIDIEAENVSSCRLIKGGITYTATPSINDYIVAGSINSTGQIKVPIGRYTLECTGLGATPVTETFATKSCILNPNIRES